MGRGASSATSSCTSRFEQAACPGEYLFVVRRREMRRQQTHRREAHATALECIERGGKPPRRARHLDSVVRCALLEAQHLRTPDEERRAALAEIETAPIDLHEYPHERSGRLTLDASQAHGLTQQHVVWHDGWRESGVHVSFALDSFRNEWLGATPLACSQSTFGATRRHAHVRGFLRHGAADQWQNLQPSMSQAYRRTCVPGEHGETTRARTTAIAAAPRSRLVPERVDHVARMRIKRDVTGTRQVQCGDAVVRP